MNAADILKYGQSSFLGELESVPQTAWDAPGVCGVWSLKDVVAHLGSYEEVLVELLESLLHERPTPMLDRYRSAGFNDAEGAARPIGDRGAGQPEERSCPHAGAD